MKLARPAGPLGASPSLWGFRRMAQRAGLSVRETKHEMTVEAAIVIANCLKNSPEIPEMKATGTNTAQRVRAMAISAADTSSIVWCAASRGDMPSSMFRSMFSTTTMASSTTMPTASTRPNSDRLLIDAPRAARIVKVPTRDTGMAITGTIVARQFWRNR